MKNTIAIAFSLFAAVAANAQTPTTPDSTQQQPMQQSAATVMTDTSINTAYIADREALRGLKSENIRPEHSFPILGTYSATGTSSEAVSVTIDSANKGIVWVEGLTQGRFKALMKKAPSTYKIPAQKTESGKSVAEGTLFLNPSSKELTIVLGRPYNDADPTAIAATSTSKQKTKAWQYTGVKSGSAIATPPASQQ